MANQSRQQAIKATSELLYHLLKTELRYRRRWQSAGRRFRSNEPAPAAIAQVLAEYLWDSGERADTELDLPRQLRDRVRRTLVGESISGETLNWFIAAFEMTPEDSLRLWASFSGNTTSSITGITNTMVAPRALGKRQWHRTVSLFERYSFASDRSYARRRTLQVIQAIEDGVDSYLFNHEPYASRVHVYYGGCLGKRYEYGGGLTSDEIMFGRVLDAGQRIAIEYETHFESGMHFPTEVRRPVRARVENLDFSIQFDLECRPSKVWFGVWPDHYLGDSFHVEPLSLDAEGAAHRFVPFAEQTVLGFKWTW